MDSQTQALAHRVGIFLAAGMVAAAFLFILAVALIQGDGSARATAQELQPYVLSALGGLLGLLGVNTVVSGVVAIKQVQATSAAASSANTSPAAASTLASATMASLATAPTQPDAKVAAPVLTSVNVPGVAPEPSGL